MNREELFKSVKKVLRDCMPEMDLSDLSEDTVISQMGIDSMGFVLIICRIEAMYNIHIPDEQWKELITIKDVMDTIIARTAKS